MYYLQKYRSNILATIFYFVFVLAIALLAFLVIIPSLAEPPLPFEQRIDFTNIKHHLQSLQHVATAAGGSRSVIYGYNASVEWIEGVLNSIGCKVGKQYFRVTSWLEHRRPYLARLDMNISFLSGVDFSGLRYGGNGYHDLTRSISLIENFGCEASDYANSREGDIALILNTNNCSAVNKVKLAESFNLSAVILYNAPGVNALPTTRIRESPWFEGSYLPTIPVLAATNSLGITLLNYEGLLHLITNTSIYTPITINIWCDTPGDESSTVVVGAHLDSVNAGSGLNDNGSGTSGILEILKQIYAAGLTPRNRIRFAWWGAEEEGLMGSIYYLSDLQQNNPTEFNKIVAGLNLDMIGSPNYITYIGVIPDTVPPSALSGSLYITSLFESYYRSIDVSYSHIVMAASSDHWSFIERGIPAGRIHSGSSQIKTVADQKITGGVFGIATDPCYHLACDTIDNISGIAMEEMSRALAKVIHEMAFNPNLKDTLDNYPNIKTSAQTNQRNVVYEVNQ